MLGRYLGRVLLLIALRALRAFLLAALLAAGGVVFWIYVSTNALPTFADWPAVAAVAGGAGLVAAGLVGYVNVVKAALLTVVGVPLAFAARLLLPRRQLCVPPRPRALPRFGRRKS